MKIAVFCKKTTFHGSFGGMETQNLALCEGLAKRGHKVTVFSPKWDIGFNEKSENGIDYIFVDSEYKYFRSSSNKNSWYNKSFEAFSNLHKAGPFDIVISQSSAGIGIIQRKRSLNIKVISIAHGSALGEFKTFLLNASLKDLPKVVLNAQYALRQFFGRQRDYVLHSNKVIAVSAAVKSQLEEETFPPSKLITVVNNGIEPFELTDKNKTSKKLLYLGHLTKDKGAEILLDIIKDVRFRDFDLDVIGDGVLMSKFQLAQSSNNTVVHLNMLGRMPHDQTLEKLKNDTGAIFVFPTRRIEGFPMVLVESMFAGLNIVAYNLGGVEDAIKDGETGVLVEFEDRKKFINKVLELANDPVRMDVMSKNARKYAEENFTLDKMLDKYEEVMKEVTFK